MRRFVNRPIFIGGWPRGGTRMISDLVTSHPKIITSDEIPVRVIESIIALVDTADVAIRKKRGRVRDWKARREDFFLNTIANTYKSGRGIASQTPSRFSNKTPLVERSFEGINRICDTQKPIFIYCARHPKKVLTSLKNMPWNTRPMARNLDLLVNSAQALGAMRDLDLSVKVVQLDKVPACYDARLDFSRSIFDFIEEDMGDSTLSFINRWPTAQPTSAVLKGRTPAVLDGREERILGELP
jgi:hypothetical protein